MKLTGNTILITGGSSGIGLELAKQFTARNNKVIITGRNKEKLKAFQQELPSLITFCGDLGVQENIDELVHFIQQHHNDLNLLINNAAVQYNYSFLSEPLLQEKISYEIATNFTAPVLLTSALLPVLLKNRNSAVVNISSGLFMAPKQSASVYCATKAAIHSYSTTLRYQLETAGVKVFEAIPPLVETAMTAGRDTSKMSTAAFANELFHKMEADHYEIYIHKAKLLKLITRIIPSVAKKMMRNGT
ncbi:MAG: SDR family NAD(P)-dependent oxidoreductase [Chitinophagaceae bacterium]|nr:SDR family NAD(P)-dependent oxidoreductase [Chitinophagaceae bacterium]